MELNRARLLIEEKKKKEQEIEEANKLICGEEKRLKELELKKQEQQKKQEIEEFVKRLPKVACIPFTICTNCNTENKLTDDTLVEFVDSVFRIIECKKCGNYLIDMVNFKRSETSVSKFEPYCLMLKDVK